MAQTPEQYYDDEESFGSYQWTTLKDIIDGMVATAMDDDHYLKNTKRSLLLYHAKQGIKALNRGVANDTLAIEMTVGTNSCIVLPQDYVDYVRVSVVTEDFKLMPLDINRNINIAIGYLQDHNANILFDDDGYILTADSSNTYNKPYKSYEFCGSPLGGQAGVDTSKLSLYGEFSIDERRGMMVFSANLIEKEVVVEYLSDGLQFQTLQEEEITVHKFIEKALKDYIYHECIAQRRTVPDSEKRRAKLEYKTSRHAAVRARSGIDLNEISRAFRAKTKHL